LDRIIAFGKKHRELLYLLGCLGLYVLLSQLLGITCLIKKTTGISCPGCGMTRALLALVRLDVSAALYYHPLVFFLLPVLTGLLVFHVRKMLLARRVLVIVSVTALLAVYLYRMILLPSPVMEFAPEKGLIVGFWLKIGSLFS